MARVLVVGGAGYIGSHMVLMLAESGARVVTLDSFETGHRDAVLAGDVIEQDLVDRPGLRSALEGVDFDAAMHFASYIQVGESMSRPAAYYRNNVVGTLNLLDALVERGIGKLVFSSSAAVFGAPRTESIDEDHPKDPVNAYGRTKLMVEQLLQDYDFAYGLRSVSLRYFNAAGADPQARLGERHDPETHLIPLALRAAKGTGPPLRVFGADYDTADGTCVRDYIHVDDLCRAHLLALDRLLAGGESMALNLGTGFGHSVMQVVKAVEDVTGRAVPTVAAPRRVGDPPRLVADGRRARALLGWEPRHSELAAIVRDAWAFEQRTTAS